MMKKNFFTVFSAVLLVAGFISEKFSGTTVSLILYICAYLAAGFDVIKEAVEKIFKLEAPDESFLMTVATIGAFVLKEYPEAVFVMLFYRVGEFFEELAEDKSRASISELMAICPESAVRIENGEEELIKPEEILTGDIIRIVAGEKIPVDGTVVKGTASLDTSALTGESMPLSVGENDSVISGCINLDGVLEIKAEKPYGESTVSKILELVENSSAVKSKSESFITRFARVYTPVTVGLAIMLAVVPPLFSGEWKMWIYRGLIMLTVSCPCALVISVPLAFFGGIGGASKKGILIKGSEYLEKLSDIKNFFFDKTGTLTEGKFKVQSVEGDERTLALASSCEYFSTHPIAVSLKSACPTDTVPENVHEYAGQGIEATVGLNTVLCGNEKLMENFKIEYAPSASYGTHVYVAENGKYIGCVTIADSLKTTSKKTVTELKKNGIEVFMLTGDSKQAASLSAKELEIEKYSAELLPQDKTEEIKKADKCAFVGDGLNDAPVLACADVGIAMGGFGSTAAIEAADIVLMKDDPEDIINALKISKKTKRIAVENVAFALTVKFAVIGLSALGVSNMSAAIFADVGVLVITVLNSMRTLKN